MKIFQTMLLKCLTFTLCLIISFSHSITAQQISVDELAEALLSQMSPEEQEQLLRETEALFKSLTPEELMELGKASEELLREELKKEGLELLPIEPMESPEKKSEEKPQTVLEEIPSTDKGESDKFGEPLIQIDSKLLNRAKIIISNIVDWIAEIEQRAENQRAYKDKIAQIQADLDLLSSLLNIVNQFKLVQYFAEEQHSATYENIFNLYNQLNQNIDAFKPEKMIEATNPYHELGLATGASEDQVKKQYRTLTTEYDPQLVKEKLEQQGASAEVIRKKVAKAKLKFNKVVESFQRIKTALATEKAFDALYKALQRALNIHNIPQGIKNIFEAHALKAAKLAAEAEKRAQEARKTQEAAAARYPSYSPMVFEQYQQPQYYYPDMYGSRGEGRGTPSPSPSPASTKPAPPEPIKPAEGKKGDDKKKEPEKPKEKILGEKTFYQALKIGNNAGIAQIEKAYSDMKKLYQQTDIDTIKDWSLITEAYEILKDKELRPLYDRYLLEYLPKDARAKIIEYKKSRGEKKKEEDTTKKSATAVKTAQEARQLYLQTVQNGLDDATTQIGLELATLSDFDNFIIANYNPQDLVTVNSIKTILSLAADYVNDAIKAIQDGRADKLLLDDEAELDRFNKNALRMISGFLTQNQTPIQKVTAAPQFIVPQEKNYILFGIPYPQGVITPQDILDSNPQKTNFVGNFINKVKALENQKTMIQQELLQAQQAAAAAQAQTKGPKKNP